MKRALSFTFSFALLLHVAPSLAAYDFKTADYPGATQTILFAINDGARVVGQYTDAARVTHAFTGDGTHFEALDPAGVIGKSASSHAYSLNNLEGIAGSYADSASVLHGFVLHGTTVTPVEYPGGYPTEAYGINDWGQVIGVYYTPDGNLHAFELDHGVYRAEDVPGAMTTVPLSINDRGQIVGYYTTVAGAYGPGYLREPDGTITTFNAPGAPANSSYLISINNFDTTVGGYYDAAGNDDNLLLSSAGAAGGTSQALLLPASFGASLQSFQTINDEGEIVGYYLDAGGLSHGFLAVPRRH